MTDVRGCDTCASLWRWSRDAPRWERVHDFGEADVPFTDESYELPPVNPWGLAMAGDGKHGYLSWDADGLHETADGGRTWHPVDLPATDGRRAGTPAIVGDHAVLLAEESCTADDCGPGTLWRARLGHDDWEQVAQPAGYFFEITTAGDALVVTPTVEGGDLLVRSTDAGTSWTQARPPRNTAPGSIGGCTPFRTGERVSVVACLTAPDGNQVLRVSSDGRTWRDLLALGRWQHGPEYAEHVLALGDRRFLVSTPKRTLLLDGAGGLVPTQTLPRQVRASACADARTCVVQARRGRLWRTVDGGQSWRVLTGESNANR